MMESGNAQLALVSTDVALDGRNGEGAWTRNKKLHTLRALFPMYDAPLVLVALKTSGINS
jgi:uncharacterized protein